MTNTNVLEVKRGIEMPVISMFYGLIIYIYYYDNKKLTIPHLHVEYQVKEAIISVADSELIEGEIHPKKMKKHFSILIQ